MTAPAWKWMDYSDNGKIAKSLLKKNHYIKAEDKGDEVIPKNFVTVN